MRILIGSSLAAVASAAAALWLVEVGGAAVQLRAAIPARAAAARASTGRASAALEQSRALEAEVARESDVMTVGTFDGADNDELARTDQVAAEELDEALGGPIGAADFAMLLDNELIDETDSADVEEFRHAYRAAITADE